MDLVDPERTHRESEAGTSDPVCKPPIRHTEDSYGESFKADLLEQYRLYAQSADNASERRVASTRYLLTINAALVAAYGFQPALAERAILAVPIALAGIILSLLSYGIIKSFRDLNTAKFEIIPRTRGATARRAVRVRMAVAGGRAGEGVLVHNAR